MVKERPGGIWRCARSSQMMGTVTSTHCVDSRDSATCPTRWIFHSKKLASPVSQLKDARLRSQGELFFFFLCLWWTTETSHSQSLRTLCLNSDFCKQGFLSVSATLSHDTVPYSMRNLRSTPEGKKFWILAMRWWFCPLGKLSRVMKHQRQSEKGYSGLLPLSWCFAFKWQGGIAGEKPWLVLCEEGSCRLSEVAALMSCHYTVLLHRLI